MARAPKSPSSSSSSSDDLTDDELWAISCQISMSSFVDLGHDALGYSFDEVDEALTACKLDAEKASMRLLRRWRSEQPPSKNTRKDLLDRLNRAEHRERNIREPFTDNIAKDQGPCDDLHVPRYHDYESVDDVRLHSYDYVDLQNTWPVIVKSSGSAASCEDADLESSDNAAKSDVIARRRLVRINRESLYLEVFPDSGSGILSSMDLNRQGGETRDGSAAVTTYSSPSRPDYEFHNLQTNSATSTKNGASEKDHVLNTLTTKVKVEESSSAGGIDFVQGSCKPLSDEEVFHVAEDIESDTQAEALGVALTFSRADINRYLATNQALGKKTSKGCRMMLFDWRQTVRQRDQRTFLKGALVTAGLVMIADQYFPDVKEMTENLKSHSNDEHESTLRNLARGIESDEQMCALGRELGFSESSLDRFIVSNRIEGKVTYKGNTDMLFEWRQGVVPMELPFRLKKSLLKAGLVFLAEKYFPDILQPEEPCLDILSAKATAIAYLRKHLIDYYKSVTCQIQRKPWDPDDFADLKNLFTNVVIYYVNKTSGTGMKEILPGSINDVFRVRVNGLLPKRILIVAAAGRGKTCAVAKMAYDWSYKEESSPLSDIPLFFALKLRVAEEDKSLGEAIMSEALGNIHGVTPESLEGFIGRHEEDCALALDGYDEYKVKLSTKNPKSNIILAIGNKIYRRCRLIVTSRPYLEKDFKVGGLARVYTKMEIEGFTQSQATSFIEKYFTSKSKPEEVGRLTEFLHGNGFSSTVIGIPLFCMMICHLWEEGLLNQVSSLTGLFDTIIQFLLAHSSSKDETFECDHHDLLQNLGKLAASGLQTDEQKVVFEDNDLQGIQEYEETGIKLGLLSKQTIPIRHMINGKTSKTYIEFFHKMAQEYCASKFLASSHCDLEQFLENVQRSATPLMYADVLRFIAGLGDDLLMSSIRLILQFGDALISKELKHRLLLDCMCEAKGDISESTTNFPTFFDNGKMYLQSLPASAVIGLGRLPPNVRKQITSVVLMYCYLPTNLTRTLWLGLQSCTNLGEMKVWECSLRNPRLGNLPFVKRLTIGHLDDTKQYASLITAVPNVESLRVESSSNTDNLQQVLDSVMTGLGGSSRKLRCLLVSGCSGQMSSLCAKQLIMSMESDAPILEKLELYNVRVGEDSLKTFVSRLRGMPSVREIGFQYCGTQEGDGFEDYLGDMSTFAGKIAVTLRHAYREGITYGISHTPVSVQP